MACQGKVVLTGMGKAGIIAQKSSATLCSTGTPSIWMHLSEAVHGDLGRIVREDLVIVLSYSGETDELRIVLPTLKKIGPPIIAVTGNLKSFLAQHADVVLNVHVEREACPLDLAPTSSTTAMLALCDALAIVLQRAKGFEQRDFAFYHPAGSLGRKLLLTVADCMRTGAANPVVLPETPLAKALFAITQARAGACVVADADGRLQGIFTDGDLRRSLEKHANVMDMPVGDLMTRTPVVVRADVLASQAMRMLEERRIDELPVLDAEDRVVGMLDVQDLLAAGVV